MLGMSRFGGVHALLLWGAAMLACAGSALAQAAQLGGVPTGPAFWNAMSFRIGPPTVSGHPRIYVTGTFDAGTADAFKDFVQAHALPPGTEIALHSPGGDPLEGMKIGETIRARYFETIVAQERSDVPAGPFARIMADQPGVCASSCSLAFLGGVNRAVPNGSLYGVHDISATHLSSGQDQLDLGQKLAGILSAYIAEMGVDSGLLPILTQYNSAEQEIYWMPPALMARLRVTTAPSTGWRLRRSDVEPVADADGSASTAWSLRSTQAGFVLEGRNTEASNIPDGFEKLVFACTGSPRHVVLGAFYMPEAQLEGAGHLTQMPPRTFVTLVRGYAISAQAGNALPAADRFRTVEIAPDDVVRPAGVVDTHYVAAFVDLTPRVAALLPTAEILMFRFDELAGGGIVSVDFAPGRAQALQFIRNCH